MVSPGNKAIFYRRFGALHSRGDSARYGMLTRAAMGGPSRLKSLAFQV